MLFDPQLFILYCSAVYLQYKHLLLLYSAAILKASLACLVNVLERMACDEVPPSALPLLSRAPRRRGLEGTYGSCSPEWSSCELYLSTSVANVCTILATLYGMHINDTKSSFYETNLNVFSITHSSPEALYHCLSTLLDLDKDYCASRDQLL